MFRDTMRKLGQPTVPSEIATDVDGALAAAEKIGYPVIIRPAFTLGGAGGGVARSADEMRERAQLGLDMSPITQILVEKYIFGWKEIEFETLRDSVGNAVAGLLDGERRSRRGTHGRFRRRLAVPHPFG